MTFDIFGKMTRGGSALWKKGIPRQKEENSKN